MKLRVDTSISSLALTSTRPQLSSSAPGHGPRPPNPDLLMESSRNASEDTNPAMRKRRLERGEGRWRAKKNWPSSEKHFSSRRFSYVTVAMGWCPFGAVAGGVRRAGCGACLSCCCCGCRSCTVKGRNWAGSRICRAPWDSRWSCRRWSAGAALGRSWISRLAAGCSYSASGRNQQREKEE